MYGLKVADTPQFVKELNRSIDEGEEMADKSSQIPLEAALKH